MLRLQASSSWACSFSNIYGQYLGCLEKLIQILASPLPAVAWCYIVKLKLVCTDRGKTGSKKHTNRNSPKYEGLWGMP
jgi:hypothetical protein